jgi:demethylmenaquinone methyltransferase/2-methoxy-6-polyprenyl-1,4-benzoquinol methylase
MSSVRAAATGAPDKHPERIAGMFDRIARRYDLLNHLLSAGLDVSWRARAIRELGLTGRERVLDVCAGTADVMIAALRAGGRGARYAVGVDFAQQMLRIGHRKLAASALADRAKLVRGDATGLPIASGTVEAATIAFGIRNVFAPGDALVDIARCLRPGGQLAILEFAMPTAPLTRSLYSWYFRQVLPRVGALVSRHDEAYRYLPESVGAFHAPGEFRQLLTDSGFVDVRSVPLTLGIVYLYVARKATMAGTPVPGRAGGTVGQPPPPASPL